MSGAPDDECDLLDGAVVGWYNGYGATTPPPTDEPASRPPIPSSKSSSPLPAAISGNVGPLPLNTFGSPLTLLFSPATIRSGSKFPSNASRDLCRALCRRKQIARRATRKMRPTPPPTAPPTIAPVCEVEVLCCVPLLTVEPGGNTLLVVKTVETTCPSVFVVTTVVVN